MRVARRSLTFASLDEVMPDVDRLLRGHTTVGNWSLGQICGHLAQGVDRTIGGFPAHLTNIGVVPIPGTHIPYSAAFFGALAIVFAVVLHATPLGRAIFAIGAGQEAAFFAGIRVRRIKFWLFVLSGLLSGFAGVLWTLRFASARYDSGVGMELLVDIALEPDRSDPLDVATA